MKQIRFQVEVITDYDKSLEDDGIAYARNEIDAINSALQDAHLNHQPQMGLIDRAPIIVEDTDK